MSKDLDPMLEGWPHEPGKISVRKILGSDGRVKLQMRVELGALQMETQGRPDGQRPHSCDSLLEYFQKRLARYRRRSGSDEGFALDREQCELLRGEALQYYYRYLSEFVLEEFDNVERDTARNLDVIELMSRYARDESDRLSMEQYRPYILMMNTRARASLALKANRPRQAMRIVRTGLHTLREFYGRFAQQDLYSSSSEVVALERMLKDIRREIPVSPMERLQRLLVKAVKEERYEEAARIRDTIAQWRKGHSEQPAESESPVPRERGQ